MEETSLNSTKECVLKCNRPAKLFDFPCENTIRNLWLYKLGLDKYDENLKVCDRHFSSTNQSIITIPDQNLPDNIGKRDSYDKLIKKVTSMKVPGNPNISKLIDDDFEFNSTIIEGESEASSDSNALAVNENPSSIIDENPDPISEFMRLATESPTTTIDDSQPTSEYTEIAKSIYSSVKHQTVRSKAMKLTESDSFSTLIEEESQSLFTTDDMQASDDFASTIIEESLSDRELTEKEFSMIIEEDPLAEEALPEPIDSETVVPSADVLSISSKPPSALISQPQSSLNSQPPPALNTAPPPTLNTEPPLALNTEPPSALNTAPPPTLNTEPPSALNTEPPSALNTAPPPTLNTEPPSALNTEPPPALNSPPPPALNTEPPPASNLQPPAPKTTENLINDTSTFLLDYQLCIQGKYMCDVIEIPEYMVVVTIPKAKELRPPVTSTRNDLGYHKKKGKVRSLLDIPPSISISRTVSEETKKNDERPSHQKEEIDYVYYMGEDENPRRDREIQVDIEITTKDCANQCDVELDVNMIPFSNEPQFRPNCAADFSKRECLICGEILLNYMAQVKHFALHKSEVPSLCPYCGEKFSNPEKLLAHEKYFHSGIMMEIQESVRCPRQYCQKAFYSKKQLYSHIDEHIENVKYKCYICQRVFSSSLQVFRHQKTSKLCMKQKLIKQNMFFRRMLES